MRPVLSALAPKIPPRLQHLTLTGPMAGNELGMLVSALPKTLMSLQLKWHAPLSCFSEPTKALMQLIRAVKELDRLETLVIGNSLHVMQRDKVWADLVLALPVSVQHIALNMDGAQGQLILVVGSIAHASVTDSPNLRVTHAAVTKFVRDQLFRAIDVQVSVARHDMVLLRESRLSHAADGSPTVDDMALSAAALSGTVG